jgi:hypothetical protein
MESELKGDLKRFGKMAFVRAADCTEAIRRFHSLKSKVERMSPKSKVQPPSSKALRRSRSLKSKKGKAIEKRQGADFELLNTVYKWVFVPMSIWPVDVRGLCLHLLDCVESGRRVDERARLLCEYLGEAPAESVCKGISEYEHAVKAGSYESLIEAQYKFDLIETELEENPEFKADWERLKGEFAVEKYQNVRGVIRRRRVEERNFRGSDWKFSWRTEAERFQLVFDAFCHRWDLYGMEGVRKIPRSKIQAPNRRMDRSSKESDNVGEEWEYKPLLLKLSVNLTPFSTMIEVPRYWSFDPKRDLKWGAVTMLHRMREVRRQGPKLSPSRAARQEEAALARRLWREATRAGLKGDGRKAWVMERLGWDVRTDESRLRRLLKGGEEETSNIER